jgi:heptose-I-phosphate ethanolaminephosphotransferase
MTALHINRSASRWGWLLAGLLCCAFAFMVFMRWQQGVLTSRPWDLAPYGAAKSVWLVIAAAILGVLIWRARQAGMDWISATTWIAGLAALSVTAYCVLPANLSLLGPLMAFAGICAVRSRRSWFFVWTLSALLLSCVSFYERRYGEFSQEALLATLQTSQREYGAYLREHIAAIHGVLAIALLAAVCTVRAAARRVVAPIGMTSLALILFVPATLPAAMTVLQQARNARDAIQQVREDERRLAARPSLEPRTHRRDLDVVFVLGESNSRWNWQLYGYPRKTNPVLTRPDKDLIVLTDSISVHSHTVPTLSSLFYRRGPASTKDISDPSVSLIDLLGSAGINTEWISAQLRHGPFATPVSRLADSAQISWFATSQPDGEEGEINHDVKAFEFARKRLAEPSPHSRLIVVHMQASHFPYCSDLPAGERRPVEGLALDKRYFGDAPNRHEDVECYDQAVRFTDRILGELLDEVKSRQRPTLFVFAPDHGEAPAEGTGHQSDAHSAKHIEIPTLVYLNPPATSAYPELNSNLQENKDRPFMNKWLFEMLVDAFGVSASDVELAAPSIASLPYSPPKRIAFPDSNPVHYDEADSTDHKDMLSRARVTLQALQARGGTPTLYAHRTNTFGKAIEARDIFPGLEMDLVWSAAASRTEVLHPPKPSLDISLREQILLINQKKPHAYWFDVKKGADEQGFWDELDKLDARFRLKQGALVELTGRYDASLVRSAAAAGWRIALPVRDGMPTCQLDGLDDVCEREATQLLDTACALGATHLSFDIKDLQIVRKHILGRRPALKLAVWDDRISIDNATFLQRLSQVANADAFAVRFDSRFGY